jgi:hypothetical protein
MERRLRNVFVMDFKIDEAQEIETRDEINLDGFFGLD